MQVREVEGVSTLIKFAMAGGSGRTACQFSVKASGQLPYLYS